MPDVGLILATELDRIALKLMEALAAVEKLREGIQAVADGADCPHINRVDRSTYGRTVYLCKDCDELIEVAPPPEAP